MMPVRRNFASACCNYTAGVPAGGGPGVGAHHQYRCTGQFFVARARQVSPRLVGLALAHVMNLASTMQWAVRQTAEAENNITSIERMLGYTRLPSEPPRVAEGGGAPPDGWPSGGAIDFHAVSARYRPGLPPVLKDMTFAIQVMHLRIIDLLSDDNKTFLLAEARGGAVARDKNFLS